MGSCGICTMEQKNCNLHELVEIVLYSYIFCLAVIYLAVTFV